MKKTLRSIVLASGLGLATACTNYDLTNERMVYGSRADSVSSDEGRYRLPLVTIAGLDLNPQRPTKVVVGEELDLMLKPYNVEGSSLVKDRSESTFDLETKSVFVIEPFNVNKNGAQVRATEFEFNSRGSYGLSAKLNHSKPRLKIRSARELTHKNMVYLIPTIRLDVNPNKEGEEELYVGIIQDDRGNITERILFEVEGTKELINTSPESLGNITLRNKDGLFHLKEIPIKDYEARADRPLMDETSTPVSGKAR